MAGRSWPLPSSREMDHEFIVSSDLLPQKQRVVMLKPAIDGPSSDPDRLTVVKTVDMAASKRQRVSPSCYSKLLNLKGNLHGVSTGDPMCPRRFPALAGNTLFSTAYISIRWRERVETCWSLLKLEAFSSYKIIYSFRFRARITGKGFTWWPASLPRTKRAGGILPPTLF